MSKKEIEIEHGEDVEDILVTFFTKQMTLETKKIVSIVALVVFILCILAMILYAIKDKISMNTPSLFVKIIVNIIKFVEYIPLEIVTAMALLSSLFCLSFSPKLVIALLFIVGLISLYLAWSLNKSFWYWAQSLVIIVLAVVKLGVLDTFLGCFILSLFCWTSVVVLLLLFMSWTTSSNKNNLQVGQGDMAKFGSKLMSPIEKDL